MRTDTTKDTSAEAKQQKSLVQLIKGKLDHVILFGLHTEPKTIEKSSCKFNGT